MGAKKRKCTFNEQLQKEFPFVAKTSASDSHMRCNTFALRFPNSHSGYGDIKTHLNSDKHKDAISVAASSSLLTNF